MVYLNKQAVNVPVVVHSKANNHLYNPLLIIFLSTQVLITAPLSNIGFLIFVLEAQQISTMFLSAAKFDK